MLRVCAWNNFKRQATSLAVPTTDTYFFQAFVSGHTEVSTTVMPPILVSESIITKSPPLLTHFPPLRQTLYASRVELFAEVSELFTHTVVQLVARNTASSQCFLQGAKKI